VRDQAKVGEERGTGQFDPAVKECQVVPPFVPWRKSMHASGGTDNYNGLRGGKMVVLFANNM
jgi:hypothetical protein